MITRSFAGLVVVWVAVLGCFGYAAADPQAPSQAAPQVETRSTPLPTREAPEICYEDYWLDPFYVPPAPALPSPVLSRRVLVRVTACSPNDPKDLEYYRANGYAGATYNIAADYRVFPKGTKIRVPGYMERSYPGKFWEVDSPGGSVIRRSTRAGVKHIDVKFWTYGSALQWGSRWLWVEVIPP